MIEPVLYFFFSALPFLTCFWWMVTIAIDIAPRRKNESSSFVFLCFVAVSTLLYFCHFVHFAAGDEQVKAVFDSIWVFCTLSVYPLFGVWVHRLTVPLSKIPYKGKLDYLFAMLPGVMMSAASFFLLYKGQDQSVLLFVVKIIFACEVIFTLFMGINDLKQFRKEVDNFYSDTDGRELRPVMVMLVLLLLVSVFSMTSNVIGRDYFYNSLLLAIPSSAFTVLLYSICYMGHKPVFDITDFQSDIVPESVDEIHQDPSLEVQDQLLVKIRKLMEEEHIYRNRGLKISDIASAVGSNRTYVSNCINRKLGMTFSDFVASYRVKYAIARMESAGEGENLENIGWESGFSGRSQFYRSFKKETGMSPSQWKAKP